MINYPQGFANKTKDDNKTKNNFKNRGLSLESLINEANLYYLNKDLALIYKKPTPIQVVKINKENIIKEAYFKSPSTTDYNGLYKGKYIDYEAKETKSKTSFPLNNIKIHQLEHLFKVYKNGGISFIIVYFTSLDEIYLYLSKNIEKHIKDGSKSIKIEEFRKNGYKINLTINPKLDYLKIINQIYF